MFPRFAAPLIGPALLLAPSAAADGGAPYPLTPDYTSASTGVATGCALADIDGDGWDDLVIANGNDIARQRVEVYYNQGGGSFPTSPDWSSADVDYHGHVSVGDVDGDGWTDVAVSVFLGPSGFSSPGRAKLYLNDGSGTLSSSPSWSSADSFYSFSLELGDADGDGDLDLAVATGEPYQHAPEPNRIYFNNGGSLDALPGWTSSESDHCLDVAFGDVDRDGDLDLAFCTSAGPQRVYYSSGGNLSTSAGWSSSAPASPFGNTLSLGDLNGDGWLDFVFSDNSQLSGATGRFLAYLNDGAGSFPSTPSWQSNVVGYVSGLALLDVDADQDLDLVGGEWFGQLYVYENDGSQLATNPTWTSSTTSVVEAVPIGDADRAGLEAVVGEVHAGDGQRKVFQLGRTTIVSVESVRVDGASLAPGQYHVQRERGYLSLGTAPGVDLVVDYTTTLSPDFAVSNWDGGVGNYLFLHQGPGAALYCYGDDLGTACPCSNASAPGSNRGCRNSTGEGARLVPIGTASVTADDLCFNGSQLPPNRPGLLFAATAQVNAGLGQSFGDGLLCAGGTIQRLDVKVIDAAGQASWGPGLIAAEGWTSGLTRRFQLWYRDPAGSCGSGFNTTNAVELQFEN